jgi:hypothetical protein
MAIGAGVGLVGAALVRVAFPCEDAQCRSAGTILLPMVVVALIGGLIGSLVSKRE